MTAYLHTTETAVAPEDVGALHYAPSLLYTYRTLSIRINNRPLIIIFDINPHPNLPTENQN